MLITIPPPSYPATIITEDSDHRFVTDNEKINWSNKLSTSNIVDNCTSTNIDKPLAANQGKVLWDKIAAAATALSTHKSSGDHDGRYYTESEMNTKLAGKSDTSHTHDGRYYTESEMNTKLSGKSDTSHNHDGTYAKKADIVNNCTSTNTDKPLSAAQGKALMDKCNQLNSDLSPIGATKWASTGTEKSVASNSVVNLNALSLTAGTWIVFGNVNFRASNATGSRLAIIYSGENEQATEESGGNADGWMQLSVSGIVVLSANTSVSIRTKQSSGSPMPCVGYISAVRIR